MFFQSCSIKDKNLPKSVGKLGTLTIVVGSDAPSSLGNDLDALFLKEDESFTGGSAFSELLKPNPNEFMQFFSNQKSILVLVTKSNLKEMHELLEPFKSDEIESFMASKQVNVIDKTDLFAQYQHIIYVFADDYNSLKNKLIEGELSLKKALVGFEIEDQFEKIYSDSNVNNDFSVSMKKELGLGFKVPKNFSLVEHKDGFWWFELNEGSGPDQSKIGLIAHVYNLRDSVVDFSYNSICAVRDSTLKYHIKGEIKGTFMGTSESNRYPARHKDHILLNGLPCVKVRAWWNIDGMMMSGPFIRYVIRIPGTNQLFAFEGFIYKPNLVINEKDLRLIESIALSIQ
ncbi:MAG: DUF4837 family protein [Bacteroidia bacterium]|nr:DUF4837 family protein [Bacteroidia bacterium]